MRHLTRTFVIAALALTACGKSDDSDDASPQTRTGNYALGDYVKYQVDREGYSLTQFTVEGEIIAVDGATAQVRWTDKTLDTFELINWNEGSNPEVETLDFNESIEANDDKRQCDYDAETKTVVETPAGTFECVSHAHTCKKADGSSYRVSGCENASVAITKDVTLKREELDKTGAVKRAWTRTLLENRKG